LESLRRSQLGSLYKLARHNFRMSLGAAIIDAKPKPEKAIMPAAFGADLSEIQWCARDELYVCIVLSYSNPRFMAGISW
jgi:hypothetical protein